MNVDEAKNILDDCDRDELRDHAFGDMEIAWSRFGFEVAWGYSGAEESSVHFIGETHEFKGAEARQLVKCGTLNHQERNDITGPDEFVLGRVQPGLSKETVRREMMKKNLFRDKDLNNYHR